MPNNDQILINVIIQQEKDERAPEMTEDDYFGLFVTELLMRKYDLNDSEIE